MIYKEQIASYKPKNAQEKNDKDVIENFVRASESNILTRENRIAHFTSSGFIVNRTFDKVLMIHHKIYKTWTWTGGHSDGEEDLLLTAIKEAKEETGLENIVPLTKGVDSIDILPVWGHMKKGHYVSAHLHLNTSFVLVGDENEKLVINEDETHGVKWFAIEDMEAASQEPELIVVYKKLLEIAKGWQG